MNKPASFWESLEQYTWKLVGRNPLPWSYVGVGVVLVSLLASMVNARYSTVGARSERELVIRVAKVGDYETARELFNVHQSQMYTNVHQSVLGAETEIESLVYPERVVENKIIETEELLTQYPGHRDIMVELARLYGELEKTESSEHSLRIGSELGNKQDGREKPRPYGDIAREYWEQARILDPNNEMFEGE